MYNKTVPGFRMTGVGRQRGAVLIVSLIFLLLMTLIGVTAMQTTTLQERMAGNMRDQNLAFQAAEAALRQGEVWLATNQVTADAAGKLDLNDWMTAVTWSDVTQAPHGKLTLTDLADDAGFYVEESRQVVHGITATSMTVENYYPVTARAVGGSTTTSVVLQSSFKVN